MRLLSYNIHKGVGGIDRRYRLERIVDVIESENPDLILLQEVSKNARKWRHDDQGAILAEKFHVAAHLFQMNVHYREGGYGNLFLSRWPLLTTHQVSLRMQGRKPRGAQLAVVDSPSGPLHVVHWHLGLIEKERQWQIHHLLNHHLFNESAHLPTIIAGDSNDWRNNLGRGPFAWRGFQQITTPIFKFRSFPAFAAIGALDKAFVRGGIDVHHVRIVRSPAAKRASDHLPLVIDFEVNGQASAAVAPPPP